jgi:hypothetical protein
VLKLLTWVKLIKIWSHFIYNPFDESLLKDFLKFQVFDRCIIIYNNPQYSEIVIQAGFKEIMKKDHIMTNGQVTIFENI